MLRNHRKGFSSGECKAITPFVLVWMSTLWFRQNNKISAILCVLPRFFIKFRRKRSALNRLILSFKSARSVLVVFKIRLGSFFIRNLAKLAVLFGFLKGLTERPAIPGRLYQPAGPIRLCGRFCCVSRDGSVSSVSSINSVGSPVRLSVSIGSVSLVNLV